MYLTPIYPQIPVKTLFLQDQQRQSAAHQDFSGNGNSYDVFPQCLLSRSEKQKNWVRLKNDTIWFEIHPFRSYIAKYKVNVIFCIDTVLFENRYISANVSETDQVEFMFASKLDGMYPVGLCLRILPGAFTYFDAGSWSGLWHMLGSVRFFFLWASQACWISPRMQKRQDPGLIFNQIPFAKRKRILFLSFTALLCLHMNRNHSMSSDFVLH